MNVPIQKIITVMKMLCVQTQMVALHVNVKMDTLEMEPHVMVSYFMILLQVKLIFFTRY